MLSLRLCWDWTSPEERNTSLDQREKNMKIYLQAVPARSFETPRDARREKSVRPAEVPDCCVELEQEDLPAQLQQTAHAVWTAGIGQQLDLVFELLQLRSCNRQRTPSQITRSDMLQVLMCRLPSTHRCPRRLPSQQTEDLALPSVSCCCRTPPSCPVWRNSPGSGRCRGEPTR